jgi:uncharacterized surface protein with fasciclin (FAS1) repeats
MTKSLYKMLAAVLTLSMLAAACGSDDVAENIAADDTSENTSTEEAMDDGPGTIVDVAVGAGSFTTLVAAVTEAGSPATAHSPSLHPPTKPSPLHSMPLASPQKNSLPVTT